MPDNLHPWRRLLAFYFDVMLFMLPFEAAWILISLDSYSYFFSLYSGLPMALLKIVTVLPLIALMTYRTKTTPGKWLMGIRVSFPPETNFTRLYKRTVYSFVLGAGMWLATICLFPLFFSYRTLKLTGSTSWDRAFSTGVRHSRLHGGKISVFIVVLLAGSLLETLPMNMGYIQRLGAYSYSPTYCAVSVRSGSLVAEERQLDISAKATDGEVRVVFSGGAYSISRRLKDIDSVTIRLAGDFHPGFPDGLEIELHTADIPNAMLALAVDVSIMQRQGSSEMDVTVGVDISDRLAQRVIYSGSFERQVDPASPRVEVIIW